MHRTLICLAVMAAALACATAQAGQHSICYETPMTGPWTPSAAFGCHEDSGGSCTITPLVPGFSWVASQVAGNPTGTFAVYQFPAVGTYTARFDFHDAQGRFIGSRPCAVNTHPNYSPGAATRGAELTGFTSDASGLVSTGVWKLAATSVTGWNRQNLSVPADFVVVGGGAMGAEGNGAMIAESTELYGQWSARTAEWQLPQPHQTTVYAIGMRINGLAARDLAPLLQRVPQDSYPAMAAQPVNQVSFPRPIRTLVASGSMVFLSGNAVARADTSNALNQIGQFLTRSAPSYVDGFPAWYAPVTLPWGGQWWRPESFVNGWDVASRDFAVLGIFRRLPNQSHPGTVGTGMLALPPKITVAGVTYSVIGGQVSATSATAANHPSVDVGGLRGEFALTGIGAAVGSNPWGNLLWKLEPRADLGGATVASQDHILASPATITGHAMGIKLVTPPVN